MELRYVNLREKKEIKDAAANWFHSKWGVPKEAYLVHLKKYLEKRLSLRMVFSFLLWQRGKCMSLLICIWRLLIMVKLAKRVLPILTANQN